MAQSPRVWSRISGRRGRLLGLVLLAIVVVVAAQPRAVETLRLAWFDVCQRAAPRARVSAPAVIVEIDGTSLARHGQWPWPRTLLARLLARIGAGNPAAIGVDIVMPEPDRLSPERLPAVIPTIDPDLALRLARLPSNDAVLAATLANHPVALGVAGIDGAGEDAKRRAGQRTPVRVIGGDAEPFLRHFEASLRSLDEIDRAAPGHGLLNVDPEGGAVRRVPLVARVAGAIVPALALDMLRLASGQAAVTVHVGYGGIAGVRVGDLLVPTQPDGSVWIRYARHSPARFVSAGDVLAGRIVPGTFDRKLVLVGVTALGVTDRRTISGGGDMDGVEIHAELIESIFDGVLLSRPPWAGPFELAFLAVGGLVVILTVPRQKTRAIALILFPLVALALGGSVALYHWGAVLVDGLTPTAGLAVVFTTMLSVTLADAERQRRALRRQVELQREAAARLEGELAAARRIQMGILPTPADLPPGERRFSLYAILEPAREVGGDLYDFFMLDRHRLFFLVGDVAGKGIPGSLFMAISKSLYKSAALRGGTPVARVMREAGDEISRDNPEALFVTVFAAVLDADSGVLEYCNAGHDAPYVISADGSPLDRLAGGGGPPLCVLDGFPYETATRTLRPGDTVCVVTDGVTEAASAGGELFGRRRLESLLTRAGSTPDATTLVEGIQREIGAFAAGREPEDDLAVLVLRWNGPPVSGR